MDPCSATLTRPAQDARVGFEFLVTRTAIQLRCRATTIIRRGLVVVWTLAAMSVAPVLVRQAVAAPGPQPPGAELRFTPFNDKLFLEARRSGAPVLLYFEADGCTPCEEMHAKTFRAPAVLEAATGIRFFRVNLSEADHEVALIKKSFRVLGAPTVILFGSDGKEAKRRIGFIPPDDFARMLGAGRKPPETA